MANFARARVTWTGGAVVGDGVSTFYFGATAAGIHAGLAAFFDAIKNQFPSTITWGIPGSGDVIDDATGALTGTWTDGADSTVVATGAPSFYVQGAGARVKWLTSGIVAGRRVVGSTFLCPILGEKFSGAGALDDAMRTQFQTAADGLLGISTALLVYSRPAPGRAGSMHTVVAAQVPDKVSWLRSRRT